MDAHSFRCFGDELATLLTGARVEKVHSPQPGTFVFAVFTGAVKLRLVLSAERQRPLCFFSGASPENPPRPSSLVMRLRKYAGGRRLGRGLCDFVNRRLLFPLPLAGDALASFLLFDLCEGPDIVSSVPAGFTIEPVWPPAEVADMLCGVSLQRQPKDAWQTYPVLTPLLRETLAELDVPEGRALLVDLEAGGGELFLYADQHGLPSLYSAWPLPAPVLARRRLTPLKLPEAVARGENSFVFTASDTNAGKGATQPSYSPPKGLPKVPSDVPAGVLPGIAASAPGGCRAEASPEEPAGVSRQGFPALAVAAMVDGPKFFALLGQKAQKEASRPGQGESKRLTRLLAKFDQEEKRLCALADMRENACLLRENLWRFAADAKMAEVWLHPSGEGEGGTREGQGGEACAFVGGETGPAAGRRILLNPLATVRENMTRMFHQSDRGKRGMGILATRRAETVAALASLHADHFAGAAPVEAPGGEYAAPASGETFPSVPSLRAVSAAPPRSSKNRESKGEKEAKQIARFVSSEGFVILCGKNAVGNQALLKCSSPHDLWLHAEGGPSAHAVIRRSHALEDVPEQTLREAAALVGGKSWQRLDAKAHIMVAFVRHVHPVKGAAPGTVHVDSVLRTITVAMPK